MTTTPPPDAYSEEIHFGVVMYGGVSLAVYINGVSHELFEMACATPRDGDLLGGVVCQGTREVYRQLSYLAGQPERIAQFAAKLAANPAHEFDGRFEPDPERTRFVVDVIAGTSAGGINGVFLAKALVNAQDFGGLADLWVKEGDLGRLLNDKQAYQDLDSGLPRRDNPPASLLSSDRMFIKLFEALRRMAPLPGVEQQPPSTTPEVPVGLPLVDELDLFLTTTDIEGAPVSLRLFDQVVAERRHKQRFHFSYPSRVAPSAESGADFTETQWPLLAFAARCTSSFPFAFEPMTLARVADLLPNVGAEQLRAWKSYFDGLPPGALLTESYQTRAFGDGGYLDNKPFSYAVQALCERFSHVPVQRKLLYVEPDPEAIDAAQELRTSTPDAVSNSMAALVSIPFYETIREDLLSILARNRRIERVEWLANGVEREIESKGLGFGKVKLKGDRVPNWATLSQDDMVEYYGASFLAYRQARIYSTTDWLSARWGAQWGVDAASDQAPALRAMVRAWRNKHFVDSGKLGPGQEWTNTFLARHDLDYRMRRLSFLLRRIDMSTRFLRQCHRELLARDQGTGVGGLPSPATGTRAGFETRLRAVLLDPMSLQDMSTSVAGIEQALAVLRDVKGHLHRLRQRAISVQRAARRGTGVATLDESQRKELLALLAALTADARSVPSTLTLKRVGGDNRQVQWHGQWQQADATGRTQHESLQARLKDIADTATGEQRWAVWALLDAAAAASVVESNVVKAAPDAPPLTSAARDFNADLQAPWNELWLALGCPKLEAVDDPREAPDDDLYTPDAVQPGALPAVPRAKVAALALGLACDAKGVPLEGPANSAMGARLRAMLAEYYLSFDAFDQPRFTLYFDTQTGEAAPVDVLRVSPLDATTLVAGEAARSKLAGTALAHFGAFLDERWRRNDLMWGRLDGAERLISSVLTGQDDASCSVRIALIERAHGAILRQALLSNGAADFTRDLLQAVAALPPRLPRQAAIVSLLDALQISPGRQRDTLDQGLQQVLATLLKQPVTNAVAVNQLAIKREPQTEPTLQMAARAVTIMGRVLEGVSRSRGSTAPNTLARWMARLGLVAQGALTLAVPGSLFRAIGRHLIILLYGFEGLLLLASYAFGSDGARRVATTALVATAALHGLVAVLGDWMLGRSRWLWGLGVATLCLLLVPLVLGLVGWMHLGPVTLVCGLPDKSAALWPWLAHLCHVVR